MAKRTPGLRKKGEIWHIEKTIAGERICKSTGTSDLEEAERILARLTQEIRRVKVHGERPTRTFDQAAAKYIEDEVDKKSLDRDVQGLAHLVKEIGHLPIEHVHAGVLDVWIRRRKANGISAGTINRDLAPLKRILTLAAGVWRDESGRPWIDNVPKIMQVKGEKRKPRPISKAEQDRLLGKAPKYLAKMALFVLHTGLRDQEICGMRWDDECDVYGLDTYVFIISEDRAKNGMERIVPLNAVARSIVQSQRGNGSDFVFDLKGKKLGRMNNKAWRKARTEAGLKDVRVHDLRHTFGMRLRSAGVEFEDRQDLLGHQSGNITTHYSKVELLHLIDCVELLCQSTAPELTLIRRAG